MEQARITPAFDIGQMVGGIPYGENRVLSGCVEHREVREDGEVSYMVSVLDVGCKGRYGAVGDDTVSILGYTRVDEDQIHAATKGELESLRAEVSKFLELIAKFSIPAELYPERAIKHKYGIGVCNENAPHERDGEYCWNVTLIDPLADHSLKFFDLEVPHKELRGARPKEQSDLKGAVSHARAAMERWSKGFAMALGREARFSEIGDDLTR